MIVVITGALIFMVGVLVGGAMIILGMKIMEEMS